MRVVYIDSLFALNFILNYLLLLLSAGLTGRPFKRRRLALGAAFGALYAVAAALPDFGWTASVWLKIGATLPIVAIAYGFKRGFTRFLLLFWLSSFLLAGMALALGLMFGGTPYIHISVQTLLFTAAAVYFVLTLALKGIARYGGAKSKIVPVTVEYGGKSVTFGALVDTGHTLTDPMTGNGVLIADTQCLSPLLPADACALLKSVKDPLELIEQLPLVDGTLRLRLIPYQTIGTTHGWLAAFKPDRVYINGTADNRLLVAFSTLSNDRPYKALVGT
jgi:stage II sporulation protein GA (sporulation sigma-E factor processing peptidase)